MRTVTTPAAQTAARQLGAEIPGLAASAAALGRHGATLADPATWAGPKAELFRTRIWPDVESTLTSLRTNLTDLSTTVAEINRRIADAGS